MVWSSFGGDTVGDLIKIERTMRKGDYKKILDERSTASEFCKKYLVNFERKKKGTPYDNPAFTVTQPQSD